MSTAPDFPAAASQSRQCSGAQCAPREQNAQCAPQTQDDQCASRVQNAQYDYEFGGFQVSLDSFPFHESEALAAFRTECRRAPELRLRVRAVPELRAPAGTALKQVGETVLTDDAGRRVRLCLNEGKDGLLYRVTETQPGELLVELAAEAAPRLGSYLLLRWLDLPGFFLKRNAVFLHASFVRWRGKALLFTGPKQIGKSTQAELWRRFRSAEVLNGDRALLRQLEGQWTACGSPFCGTSGICVNAKAPLAALVLLEQAPENRAERAGARDLMRAFLSGCSFDASEEATRRVLDLAAALGGAVPVLRLRCRPDEAAVACLEEALYREGAYA